MPNGSPLPWWKTAVAYQIYPRSFADTNGDGVGDLEGIRQHLDHLVWLGVDAVWISPFFRSPMKDYGYDISDYCDVDPLFGDLAAFDALLADAHERGLKVLIDWVPNHTSDQHVWFVDSKSDSTNARRNWYVWRDPAPDGGPPNNWVGSFMAGPAWTFDPSSGQYYLHCFLAEQPDLNWQEPAVVAAMHDTLRFWLDRGVDGFRMDVIHLIGKDPSLPDDDPALAALTHVPLNHRPETHTLLRDIRSLLDEYDGDRTSVGEVYLLDTSWVAEYYGQNDELHLCFNFLPLYTPFHATAWRRLVAQIEAELNPRGAWPTWVLSNHDNQRHRTRFGGSETRCRAAAFLLLGLRGTPFLYAGEELGLADAVIPDDRRLDPGNRDGCRAPIPWNDEPSHGWATADPWLPWPPDVASVNAVSQVADPDSLANLYRRLLRARRASAALQLGDLGLLELGAGVDRAVLAWNRIDPRTGDRRVVAVNFSDEKIEVPLHASPHLTGSFQIEVSSNGEQEGDGFSGVLNAESAVILRPH